MDESPVRVGVLSLHTSKETKAILNAIEDLGHEAEWLRRENTAIHITRDGIEIDPDVDVVLNRLLLSRTDQAAELLGLASMFEDVVPVLNRPGKVLRAMHKFATGTSLVEENILVPEAYLALDPARLDDARAHFDERAVYKFAIGTHGDGTQLVDVDQPLEPMAVNRQAFLQEFIPTSDTNPFDYRVYVIGDEIVGAMKRTARSGEFRTNVAEGGEVADATDELPPAVGRMAHKATEVIGLDYAGIDIIHRDDEWFVLEVNPTAGFRGLFKATGVSPAPYIARLAIEKAGQSVDDASVTSIASELDDSVPSCLPAEVQAIDADGRPIIGYTEQVTVTGTAGTKRVLAKSDTGARRTSIDLELAASIGAGPIKHQTRVRSGLRQQSKARPVVDLLVGIDGHWHTVTASVEDRGHMEYPVLIGRDILSKYHVDVTRSAKEE